MQWGWNHNPDPAKWSLNQNPGYLRLSTTTVVSSLRDAQNTLTQRIFAYYSKTLPTTAVVKMEVDKMINGDVAGLAVFQNPYAFIGVKKIDSLKYVVMVNNGKTIDSALINTSTIYLKAQANYGTSKTSFAYSFDNNLFKRLGNDLSMQFNLSIFTGNKFCLFNYATIEMDGFVDFDWFRIDWSSLTGVVSEKDLNYNDAPHNFLLGQNYPNPFNPTTVISYQLAETSKISLKVNNLLGQEVATLFEGVRQPGNYSATFDGRELTSGIYLCSLRTSGSSLNKGQSFFETKKLLLLK